MKAFLVPAMIFSFHRRSLLALPVAAFVLAALAGWLIVVGSGAAQLAPAVDHFKCYQVNDLNPPAPSTVTLTDQFESQLVSVQRAVAFCNPVQKTLGTIVTPITNPDSHVAIYQLAPPLPTEPVRTVDVKNQFGLQQLTVTQPLLLAVPTLKQPNGPPHDLDHFKCYQASGPPVGLTVDLQDQFHLEPGVPVMQPEFFCNPTEKIHGTQTFPITNPAVHMVCYRITATTFSTTVGISNQFVATDTFQVFTAQDLCVPSQKLAVNTPTPVVTNSPTPSPTPVAVLDHFKCYPVSGPQPHSPETVTLTDQFNSQDRLVSQVVRHCNPVEKTLGMVITPITNPDSHLTWFQLATMTETPRVVDVSNQFGNQRLSVHDAQYLLVPTQKDPFGPPHDLDHFKCYQASGPPVNQIVDLRDQFHVEPGVQVLQPDFLCNPVDKIHFIRYPIMHPDDHLVCYRIVGGPINLMVNSISQFNPPQSFQVLPADELCVPSLKGAVCTDTDGDVICDSTDNCPNWPNPGSPQPTPNWTVPADDPDCDGFPSTIPLGTPTALSSEAHMTTDPASHCASTVGPLNRNDEPLPDRWPVDYDDSGQVNGSDLLPFAPVWGKMLVPFDPLYDPRFDLNNDNKINGSDLLKFAPFWGKKCAVF